MTADQKEEFKKIFALWDTDGDGVITQAEMNDFWRSIGETPKNNDKNAVFMEFEDFLNEVGTTFLAAMKSADSESKSIIETLQNDFKQGKFLLLLLTELNLYN